MPAAVVGRKHSLQNAAEGGMEVVGYLSKCLACRPEKAKASSDTRNKKVKLPISLLISRTSTKLHAPSILTNMRFVSTISPSSDGLEADVGTLLPAHFT